MTPEAINAITRWTVLGAVLAWAVWELVLVLWLRPKLGREVKTISMEARALAFRGLPSIAYAFAGLSAHWFITWGRLPWEGWLEVALAVLWWAVLAAYLLADLLYRAPREEWPGWLVWARYPPVAALAGAVLAFTCFPQRSTWIP